MLFHALVTGLIVCAIGIAINVASEIESQRKNSKLDQFRRDVKVRRMREREQHIAETNDKITGIFVETIAKASINGIGNVLTK